MHPNPMHHESRRFEGQPPIRFALSQSPPCSDNSSLNPPPLEGWEGVPHDCLLSWLKGRRRRVEAGVGFMWEAPLVEVGPPGRGGPSSEGA